MKIPVILSICGRQAYVDQEPDTIELVTEGTLEHRDGVWTIQYEESDLTGLQGVTTVFRVDSEKVELTRQGRLHSHMVFQKDIPHDSLYQMEFGALMITVCANRIFVQLDESGGIVDLVYNIEIEQTTAGEVDYHLEIRKKA